VVNISLNLKLIMHTVWSRGLHLYSLLTPSRFCAQTQEHFSLCFSVFEIRLVETWQIFFIARVVMLYNKRQFKYLQRLILSTL